MFQMYAEPGNSYGDITRYFVKHSIKVYDKALQRAFISKLLRNPVYVQADMDIYEYFKAQGVKKSKVPRKCSQGTIAVISIKGARARSQFL